MDKPYLLVAGYHYYPSADTGDWIACFATYDEALEVIRESQMYRYEVYNQYENVWNQVDWYKIIDLRDWQ